MSLTQPLSDGSQYCGKCVDPRVVGDIHAFAVAKRFQGLLFQVSHRMPVFFVEGSNVIGTDSVLWGLANSTISVNCIHPT